MDSMPNIDGIKRIKFCDYIEITDISDEVFIYNLFYDNDYGFCLSIEGEPLIKFLHIKDSMIESYYVNGEKSIKGIPVRNIDIDTHWLEKKFRKGFTVEGFLLQYTDEMGIKYGLHPEEYYNKNPESYKEIVKVKKKSKERNN